jgi:hypothetical protein
MPQQALSAFWVHVFSLTKFYQHHPFSANSCRIGKPETIRFAGCRGWPLRS